MAREYGGLPIVAHPRSPDVFADEALGFEIAGGVVRITLASRKMADGAPPSDVQWEVIGRLLMPARGAQGLAVGLFNYLKSIGLDSPAPAAPDPPAVQ
ncbi:MAG TPA: hypothetical protein VEA60_07910 [Allosphingosinicella sp.]|nr:hypothetical protein [Allosphingosinicella sp.]